MASSRNTRPINADLQRRLAARLGLDMSPEDRVALGFSGGLDSLVLADLLAQYLPSERLQLVHVHHGLSPNADHWANFCTVFAQERGLSIDVHRVTVDKSAGKGIEAAARDARWAVFAQYPNHVLALAHHQDDQAETVLFRLFRGTGVQGISGMAGQSHWQGQRVWRPLLDVSKRILNDYAVEKGLCWIEDESNGDTHYSRNYVRHAVLPVIEQRFPAAPLAICRLAEHAAEAAGLLDELAAQDLQAVWAGEGDDEDESTINLFAFQGLSAARQRNLLRYWLRQAGWHPPERHTLDEWMAQLGAAKAHQPVRLSYSQGQCVLRRGRLIRQSV